MCKNRNEGLSDPVLMQITLLCPDHHESICADTAGPIGLAALAEFAERHRGCRLLDRSDDPAALDRLIEEVTSAVMESEPPHWRDLPEAK